MALMREETFGPVLPIVRVRDVEEAIARANDTSYGLGANVWTRDAKRGREIAVRIDSGSVCINDMTMTYGAIEAPFGGRKESGVGQVNGRARPARLRLRAADPHRSLRRPPGRAATTRTRARRTRG